MKGVTGNTQKRFTPNCFKNVLSTSENPYGHHSVVDVVFFFVIYLKTGTINWIKYKVVQVKVKQLVFQKVKLRRT